MKNIFNLHRHYHKVKAFHSKYERFLMPAFLVLGSLVDYITFVNVSISTSLFFLLAYWITAGACIAFIALYDSGALPPVFSRPRFVAVMSSQFLFGALLSGSMVFYWFSGALSISWPFIASIAFLMLFNNVFREFFSKPTVQLCLYFFITFSFFILALPFLFNSISAWIFVAAGLLSLAVFLPYTFLLFYIGHLSREKKHHIFASIFIIFVIINALYFFNIIPPIPLSIREAQAFHSLAVSGEKYRMQGEPETFWQALFPGQTLHLAEGERAYLYTAIFAPVSLNTTIVHQWQHYDQTTKKWIVMSNASFDITGGRKDGYKGYSWFLNPKPGKWRVYVKTPRGQVLGKIDLNIERLEEAVGLQETIR